LIFFGYAFQRKPFLPCGSLFSGDTRGGVLRLYHVVHLQKDGSTLSMRPSSEKKMILEPLSCSQEFHLGGSVSLLRKSSACDRVLKQRLGSRSKSVPSAEISLADESLMRLMERASYRGHCLKAYCIFSYDGLVRPAVDSARARETLMLKVHMAMRISP